MERKLLLISNSTLHGSGYLDHCADNICQFLGKNKKVLFVPFARPSGISHEEYTKIARKRFERMGYSLFGINSHDSPIKAVEDSEAIFIGGGNTFVLLNELYKKKSGKYNQTKSCKWDTLNWHKCRIKCCL